VKKILYLFMFCILASSLAACNLPGIVQTAPLTAADQPLATKAAQEVAPTPLPATLTKAAPTRTSVPPTATQTTVPTPAPAIKLDLIRMKNEKEGWGWASTGGNMNQLLNTSDGGQTWRDVSPQGNYVYYDSYFFDAQTAWLTYTDSTTNAYGMLRSMDAGKTWVNLPPNEKIQGAFLEFTSPLEGVAETASMGAGNAYLNYYQTKDGGETWEPIPLQAPKPEPGLPEGTVHLCNICGDNLYYDAGRVIITYGDMASDPVGYVRLAVTTDLGKHWKNLKLDIPQPYTSGSVSPLPPAFFGEQGLLPVNIIKYKQDGSLDFSVLLLYSSMSGGQTWKVGPAVIGNQYSRFDNVQILSPADAFVRCGKGLCSTNDAAQTWLVLPETLNFDLNASGADYISQINFVSSSTGWVISGESGATILWTTTDGGLNWSKLEPTLVK